MDDPDSVDGALDPRIQIELENLNDATDDINKLETELDEAHAAFRQLLSETTKRLQRILNKVGNSCVEKARCYYDALEVARQAQIKCQQQAQLFQRASEIHAAAKETVALAESRFVSNQHEWHFDQAWQDMLNHATLKVMDAENQKAECGREHYRRAVLFHDAEKKLLHLEEKHRRAIIKARPYFEVKAQCEQMLATQKERVECLQKTVQDAKTNYANSLRRLEEISNQIHQQRRDYDFIANGPREPGVGAELASPQKILGYERDLKQLNGNKSKDITNNPVSKYNKVEEYSSTCNFSDGSEHLGKRSVDGSEATSSQWELELAATMDSLNNLAHDGSVIERESKHEDISALRFHKVDSKISNNFSQECSNNFLQSGDYSMLHLIQSKKLNKNINIHLGTHFRQLSVVHNDITDSVISNKNKICYKANISKSANNSPAKANECNIASRIAQKESCKTLARYVPNSNFKFDFNEAKSLSSGNIDSFSNFNVKPVQKCQSLDDIAGDKTDNTESDKQNRNLRNNTCSLAIKEVQNMGLKLDYAQLNNATTKYFTYNANIKRGKQWFRYNSVQCLSSSACVTQMRIKENVSLSSENILNKKLQDHSNRSFATRQAAQRPSNVNELPLLSLKSFSMINLDDTKSLISDPQCNSVRAASTSRLANSKYNSFSSTAR